MVNRHSNEMDWNGNLIDWIEPINFVTGYNIPRFSCYTMRERDNEIKYHSISEVIIQEFNTIFSLTNRINGITNTILIPKQI